MFLNIIKTSFENNMTCKPVMSNIPCYANQEAIGNIVLARRFRISLLNIKEESIFVQQPSRGGGNRTHFQQDGFSEASEASSLIHRKQASFSQRGSNSIFSCQRCQWRPAEYASMYVLVVVHKLTRKSRRKITVGKIS